VGDLGPPIRIVSRTSHLGLKTPISLGLPDGKLRDHEILLADTLNALVSELRPGAWCAATWRGDGHPDHEAVGRAAAVAAQRAGAKLLEYPAWMWHWARPDDAAVPWHRMARVAPDRAAVVRKQVAAREFRSQLTGTPLTPTPCFRRSRCGGCWLWERWLSLTERLPDRYFDELNARSCDPWHLADRWYEKRKYAITLAMLPQPTYRHALELGCSVGVLTEALAARCDHVTATHVTLECTSIDCAWPADDFDLVVLSEVAYAYYLSENTLRRVLECEVPKLMPGTTLLAAHCAIRSAATRSMATQPMTSSARRRHCTKRPTIETATSSSTSLRTRHRLRWPRTRAYPEPTHKPTDPTCAVPARRRLRRLSTQPFCGCRDGRNTRPDHGR
jgi:hypothetical protein